MKSLLIKEIRLAASPLSWCFIAFGAMAMIPGYPILVCAFFICFGIFHTFQNSREQNDLLYTILLPVRKTDAVKVKYAFTVLIQLLGFLVTFALTLVRMLALPRAAVYAGNAMMNANPVFLAWILVIFALFNTVFLGGFFRTGYKIGKPFLLFGIGSLLALGVAETMHHLPGMAFLNATDAAGDLRQWLALVIAFAVCGGATWLSCRRSMENFEKLDL